MKSAVILCLVTQILAAAVSAPSCAYDGDTVDNRDFVLPNVEFDKRDPDEGEIKLPPANTHGNPDPDEVHIIGMTYGGSGCPSGSVASVLSDDRTVMTLIFDEYIAAIGPDVSVRQNRKNCQINLNLRYPGGFQYSIFSADYRGYANLDRGVRGAQKSTYYFSGQQHQTSTQTDWVGPYEGDYFVHDEADSTSTVWSPCGANGALNINSQIRLTSSDRRARGILTNDSLDASFKQIVHVRWRECHS